MRTQLGPIGTDLAAPPADDPSLDGAGVVRVSAGWVGVVLVAWHLFVLGVFLLGVRLGSGG